jgi:hypothetical protein
VSSATAGIHNEFVSHLNRFTYAISFAALIAAAAGESDYWGTQKGIQGSVLFFLVPLFLVILNSFGVEVSVDLHW